MPPPDPLPKKNPLEPQFLDLLRAFAANQGQVPAEGQLAAAAYLELLRSYLIGARDTIRAATIVAPAAVSAFFSSLPKPSITRTEELVLGHAPAAIEISPPLVNLLSRDPFLAQTAEEVAAAFTHSGIAFARSASIKTTMRVQEIIGNLVQAGTPNIEARDIIAEATGWTKGYAETAYRTVAMQAYTGGRIDTQLKPFVSSIFLGFQVVGSNDADTRRGRPEDRGENHLAALGLVAANQDPIWDTHTPPYGFNCRHTLRSISRMEARREGWLSETGKLERQPPPNFNEYNPKAGFGIKPPFRA